MVELTDTEDNAKEKLVVAREGGILANEEEFIA